jgi:hypothetical protein
VSTEERFLKFAKQNIDSDPPNGYWNLAHLAWLESAKQEREAVARRCMEIVLERGNKIGGAIDPKRTAKAIESEFLSDKG